MYHRGLKDVQIGRDLDVVWIEYELRPEGKEERAIEAMRKRSRQRAKHAAAMIDRLIDGEAPEEADLEAIGGAAMVAAVAQPAILDVPDLEGMKVPGGARHSVTEPGPGVKEHRYNYRSGSPADVMKIVQTEAETGGWTPRCPDHSGTPRTPGAADDLDYRLTCDFSKAPLVVSATATPSEGGVVLVLEVREEAPPPPPEAEAEEVAEGEHHGVPGVEDLRIPGPCSHRGIDHGDGKGDHTYTFPDAKRKAVRKMLKAAAREGGWKVTPSEYDDYTFELTKGEAKVSATIKSLDDDGAELAITVW